MKTKLIQTKDYLLLIDEEAEIKDKEIVTDSYGNVCSFADLSFLGLDYDRTTIHKVIAYYPLTKEAKELDLPLLPPFEEVDIFKLMDKETQDYYINNPEYYSHYIAGYKAAQQAKQFSLEDMWLAVKFGFDSCNNNWDETEMSSEIKKEDYDQFIQSLSTQQLPKEFIPEYEREHDDTVPFPKMRDSKEIKTIINSEGKVELVGTWKY